MSFDQIKESCATSLTSSLALISSAGIAIQDGTLASAAVLAELTLARRDAVLRKLTAVSPTFVESMRNAPIISPDEPVELPTAEGSVDLFGGLATGLRADRLQEATSKSTELVLRAYYGKDSHKQFKRPASHRGNPKRPRTGPSYRT